MGHIIELENNGLKEVYEFNKVARQADGSVLYRQGKAVLLATVTIDKESCIEEDFLPLTVQYIEKFYAAAKIPGGFVKREAKPSDFETLTSRIVDRAVRPLFPKGFNKSVVINITVFSSDSEVDLQVAALHAANAALIVSTLPVKKSVAAVRVGKIGEKIIYNPKLSDLNRSKLDLLIVGSGTDIAMIEMKANASKEAGSFNVNELQKDELMSILKEASGYISSASENYLKQFVQYKREDLIELESTHTESEIKETILKNYSQKLDSALKSLAKSERLDAVYAILKEVTEQFEAQEKEYKPADIKYGFELAVKEKVREIILNGTRLDGRKYNEVRPISIETNLLPSVHGSALFTRGETQALVTVTLGDSKDAQMYELLTSSTAQNENFMVHYNFPPYSVGEAKPIGAVSRRELGHGNLAKRALEPSVEMEDNQTIRVVSEILESNGSSSMATVCGGSLALHAAKVNVKKLIAGIAMGVIVENSDKYTVLTDIMGAEDHYGDMDFKVAGSRKGITALQLDIKIDGLDLKVLEKALSQAIDGLNHILDIMEEAKENIVPSKALPSVIEFEVNPSKIPLIIGKGGSTIREIIDKFNVSIDLNRDKGIAKITGGNIEDLEKAKEYILELIEKDSKPVTKYEIGKIYKGKISKVVDFGYFVEMPDGYDALLHNSKVPLEMLSSLKEGDEIEVKVISQKDKKVELIMI